MNGDNSRGPMNSHETPLGESDVVVASLHLVAASGDEAIVEPPEEA
jgi:hypothetical protein